MLLEEADGRALWAPAVVVVAETVGVALETGTAAAPNACEARRSVAVDGGPLSGVPGEVREAVGEATGALGALGVRLMLVPDMEGFELVVVVELLGPGAALRVEAADTLGLDGGFWRPVVPAVREEWIPVAAAAVTAGEAEEARRLPPAGRLAAALTIAFLGSLWWVSLAESLVLGGDRATLEGP